MPLNTSETASAEHDFKLKKAQQKHKEECKDFL